MKWCSSIGLEYYSVDSWGDVEEDDDWLRLV